MIRKRLISAVLRNGNARLWTNRKPDQALRVGGEIALQATLKALVFIHRPHNLNSWLGSIVTSGEQIVDQGNAIGFQAEVRSETAQSLLVQVTVVSYKTEYLLELVSMDGIARYTADRLSKTMISTFPGNLVPHIAPRRFGVLVRAKLGCRTKSRIRHTFLD